MWKFTYSKRMLAVLLCALILLLATGIFSLDHDCSELHCPICQIAENNRELFGIGRLTVLSVLGLLIFVGCFDLTRTFRVASFSPVALKVKITS